MTQEFFLRQIDRLKRRFGDKNFDVEFIRLVSQEVKTLSELGFQRAVDIWIGSRSPHKPPLLSEFREARLNEEKTRLERDANQVTQSFNSPARDGGLKKVLKEQFGNVSSVKEAVELIRLKKRLADAEK